MLCENIQRSGLKTGTCIAVVFSSTSSKMGRLIRFVTKYQYNHVSLSLEEDLHRLYSFARYCKNAPLVGGFVEESILRYIAHTPVPVKICKIPLSAEDYRQITECIAEIRSNSREYIYNSFSAALVPVHRKLLIPKAYTCLEFVQFILSQCHFENGIRSELFISMPELEQALSQYTVYEGVMPDSVEDAVWENDRYCLRINSLSVCASTVKHFGKLICRSFCRSKA